MIKTPKLLIFGFLIFLYACGGGGASDDSVEGKKEALKTKKQEFAKLGAEIAKLESEIKKLDPEFKTDEETATLVSTIPVGQEDFTSYIEVQGVIHTDDDVMVTPEVNGVISYLAVSEGQFVAEGQVLLSQKSEIVQRNIDQVNKSLELAKTVYERQKKLWDQNIGTEIQYLQAKNNKENLEEQLRVLQAQSALSTVTAPFSGVVEELFVKKGQVAMPGSPLMRLVGVNKMKVVAEVSETYLKKVNTGDPVGIEFPSLDISKENVKITRIGSTINPDNRTFKIEMNINRFDKRLKPELLTI